MPQEQTEKKAQKENETNKKARSPWILVAVLSCFVLILVFGIIGYSVYRLTKNNYINLQNKNDSVIFPQYDYIPNSRYGFSLSIPSSWWTDESENKDGMMMSPDVKSIVEFNNRADEIVGVTAYGWNNNGQTLDQFLSENKVGNDQVLANYKIEKQTNVKLGDQDAVRLDESYRTKGGIQMKRISIYHLDAKIGLAIIATCPESKWSQYNATINTIIDSFKLNPDFYKKEAGTLNGTNDTEQIMSVAKAFVKANSISGMQFALILDKQTGDWARLTATPTGEQKADEATVLLHKVNGQWTAVDFGTDLSQWQSKTPAGFWTN